MPRRNSFSRLPLIFLAAVLFASLGVSTLPGSAQSTGEDWTTPTNLSRSGSTSNPVAVVDSNGRTHAVWKDEFADWVYSIGDEAGWSAPVAADYIFRDQIPKLYPDASGGIQVLWIDEEGVLYQGWSRAETFGSPASWSGTQIVGSAAASYDLALDSQGVLHLVYIRNLDTPDFPAGVYYRRSTDNGASWSPPVNLYASPYMRALTEQTGSIDVAVTNVGGVEDVYVAWDNQPVKRVLLIKSEDGGQTWGDTAMIDGPTATTVSSGPFHLRVNPEGQNVLLVWNTALQSDFACTQLSQYSADGGKTWSAHQVMFENIVGCPEENQFIQGEGGLTILMSSVRDQAYLTAWDGVRWSESQAQAALFSFTDQENYRSVDFRCRQVMKTGPDRITVVGCDKSGGGDIWATSDQIGGVEAWFPPMTAWTPPQTLIPGEVADGSVAALSDSNGAFHVVWSQLQRNDTGDSKWKVYYTREAEQNWTEPLAVLESPTGNVEAPSAVIDAKDRLFVVWRDDLTGELYYSWANAGLANSTFEWVTPQILPISQLSGSSPHAVLAPSSELMVAYAVPVNEGRGIYLIRSQDAGETWSSPVQVFDGASNGWTVVDHPRISISENGTFHLVWTRNILGAENRAVELYYARSVDGGQNWSEAELVAEQPIAWATVESEGDNGVHRMWLGADGDTYSLWDQSSVDDGENWSQPLNLTNYGENPGPASATKDALGRLNLMESVADENGKVFLQHWTWENEVWNEQSSLELGASSVLQVTSLGANNSRDGRMLAVFAKDDRLDYLDVEDLQFTGRQSVQVVPPQSIPVGGKTETAAPEDQAAAPATVIPTNPSEEISATPQSNLTPVMTQTGQDGPVSTSSRFSGLLVGGVFALLVVGLASGLALIVVKRSAKQK